VASFWEITMKKIDTEYWCPIGIVITGALVFVTSGNYHVAVTMIVSGVLSIVIMVILKNFGKNKINNELEK